MGSEGSKRGRMLLGSDLDDMASPVGPSAGEFALDENPESLNGISGTRSILDKRPSFRNSTDGATVMLDFDTYETPVDPQYMSDFNNKYVLGHGSRVTNGYFGTGGRDGATGGQRGLETTQPVVDYGNATLRSVFTEETRPTRPKLQAQPFRTFTSTPVDVASAVAEPYRPPPIRKGDIIPPNPFRPRSGVFRHPSDGSYRSYSPGLREGARIHYATEQSKQPAPFCKPLTKTPDHTPSPYRETQKVELLTLPKPPHHNADRRSIFSFLSYRAPRSTNRNTRVNSWGTGVWGGGNLEAAPIDEVVDKRSHLSRFIQNNAFTLWCVALVGTLVLVAVITWLVSVKLRRVDYSGKLAEMVQANAPVMAQSYGGEV